MVESAARGNGGLIEPLIDRGPSESPIAAHPEARNSLVLEQPIDRAGMTEQVLGQHRYGQDLVRRTAGRFSRSVVAPFGYSPSIGYCLHSRHRFAFFRWFFHGSGHITSN